MNIFSTSVLLALLCISDTSLSFLINSGRRPDADGKVNAVKFRSTFPFAGAAKSKTRLLYYGDYDDNYLHFNSDISDGTNYLHRMSSTLRGGNTVDNSEYAGINSLSVSELKRLLTDRGVDFRDCLEKRDLVERLMSSKGSAVSTSYSADGYNNGGAGGLSYEENRVVNTFTRSSPAVAYIQTISQSMQISRGFSLKGTEVPTGAGSGFLWDDKVIITTYYDKCALFEYSESTIHSLVHGTGSYRHQLSCDSFGHKDKEPDHQSQTPRHGTYFCNDCWI